MPTSPLDDTSWERVWRESTDEQLSYLFCRNVIGGEVPARIVPHVRNQAGEIL
jgi:hypothetical protein